MHEDNCGIEDGTLATWVLAHICGRAGGIVNWRLRLDNSRPCTQTGPCLRGRAWGGG